MSSSDGDWEGLYIDGKLIDQNHSLCLGSMIEEICHYHNNATYLVDHITFETKEANREWLFEECHLPEDLSDVRFTTN